MSSGNFLFYGLMMMGPMVAVSSSNWLVCWAGVELSFLGLIPVLLSDSKSWSTLSSESSLKYFCVQAAGSGVLMWGGIMQYMMPMSMGLASEVLFFFGLILKLGIFPLHFWVPSVVSGFGWFPMFLVLTWQKLAPFLFLMNLIEHCPWLGSSVLVLGGASAITGAVIGLNQTKLGPLLGASSVTHTGWVAIGAVYGNFWVYYLIYCASMFFLVIFLEGEDKLLSGLMMLSLSGLPPFLMFVGKWSVMKAALSLGDHYWFLIPPLAGSVMSLFFYLKIFYSFYLEEPHSSFKLSLYCCVSMIVIIGAMWIVGF